MWQREVLMWQREIWVLTKYVEREGTLNWASFMSLAWSETFLRRLSSLPPAGRAEARNASLPLRKIYVAYPPLVPRSRSSAMRKCARSTRSHWRWTLRCASSSQWASSWIGWGQTYRNSWQHRWSSQRNCRPSREISGGHVPRRSLCRPLKSI